MESLSFPTSHRVLVDWTELHKIILFLLVYFQLWGAECETRYAPIRFPSLYRFHGRRASSYLISLP